MALANYPIEGQPKSPLAAYKKDNMVKLFLFDVGLLNHMLGSSYKEIKQQSYEYKGYVAENFVQQELTAINIDPSYSWNDARAEIEFILATDEGDIIPIEVKSGKRTRAKSLTSYIENVFTKQNIQINWNTRFFDTRANQYSDALVLHTVFAFKVGITSSIV